ncbi:MAG: response regulator [Robiginitomaculum sp.]|nr:response regulator [Robiginitomaculum sp.]
MTNETAIVIDDDYDITGILSELLESQGVRVLGMGYTGVDAIHLFKTQLPKMVFMDVHMPIKDGISALKEIKKISSKSIVIMITGDTSSLVEEQLQTLGADSIIHKPFRMKNIIQIIKEIQKHSTIMTT